MSLLHALGRTAGAALRAAPVLLLVGLPGLVPTTADPHPAPPPEASPAGLPRVFVEEPAGVDGPHRFVAAGRNVSAVLAAGGPSWIVTGTDADGRPARVRVDVVPLDATQVVPEGTLAAPGRVQHFQGPPATWGRPRPTWRSVTYRGVWDGVDLVVETTGSGIKSTYAVAAGADPSRIVMRLDGALAAHLDDAGRLVVQTAAGSIVDEAPIAWQADGRPVPVAFTLRTDGSGAPVVAFDVGVFDRSQPLLLDPAVVTQAGFLGGAGDDVVSDMTTDAAGNIYVCGWTDSSELTFPVAVGPDLTYVGDTGPFGDAFVAKLDPTGTTILYAGYIGGWESDWASGIAVDAQGRAYVVGHTDSSVEELFPATVGPDLTLGGSVDGWIARVSADGSALEYCGYIGGILWEDRAFAVDVDAQGRAHVAGRANSDEDSFPATVGPSLVHSGQTDGFLARLTPDGTGFEYCGYVGGALSEDISDLVVAPDGSVWFCGYTNTDEETFPVTVGPSLTYGGSTDGFVGKLSADGTTLLWLGYVGGSESDTLARMDVDPQGAVYVCGTTLSTEATLPVSIGPDLTFNGWVDTFVAKVTPDGSGLAWCGYVGGSEYDTIADVAVDDDGRAWISGLTSTTKTSPIPFPLVGGPDATHNGGNDGFVARIAATGLGLDFCGYVGGAGSDGMGPIALVAGGTAAWVSAGTNSTEATYPAIGGPDLTQNGATDAALVYVEATDADPPAPTLDVVGLKGRLRDTDKPAKDKYHYKGTFAFGVESDGVLDPATDDLVLTFGSASAPLQIAVPAGDAGWKVKANSLRWKSAKGVTPKVTVLVNLKKGRLGIKASKLDFPGLQELPIMLELVMGNDAAAPDDTWEAAKKPGAFKLVK